MHECLLCKRDMKVSNDVFGSGCVRNIYTFLNLEMPRKINLREETLYKSIMKLTNTRSINNNQKIWLTDRYLTYQYLNKIPYGNYNSLKRQINNDIQNIKQVKKDEELKSKESLTFEDNDLYFAIHKANIEMKAEKDDELIWNINVKLSDTFDFTKFKMPNEYYNDAKSVSQSLVSSTLYNLAFISYKLGVIKEYQVIAELSFKVKDGEIID